MGHFFNIIIITFLRSSLQLYDVYYDRLYLN